jgi:hypothetical protein
MRVHFTHPASANQRKADESTNDLPQKENNSEKVTMSRRPRTDQQLTDWPVFGQKMGP